MLFLNGVIQLHEGCPHCPHARHHQVLCKLCCCPVVYETKGWENAIAVTQTQHVIFICNTLSTLPRTAAMPNRRLPSMQRRTSRRYLWCSTCACACIDVSKQSHVTVSCMRSSWLLVGSYAWGYSYTPVLLYVTHLGSKILSAIRSPGSSVLITNSGRVTAPPRLAPVAEAAASATRAAYSSALHRSSVTLGRG